MADVVRVHGLRETQRAFKRMQPEVAKGIDVKLRDAGGIVARDATRRFAAINQRSAAGFRSRVKGFGRLVVDQRRRKTTGLHPEYGALQMRKALLPARKANTPLIEKKLEELIDDIAHLNGF